MRHYACIALLFLAASFAHAEPDIVASVNGAAITRATLEQALARRTAGATAAESTPRKAVREQLIAEELLWQKAREAGMVEDNDRPTAVARYIERNLRPTVVDADAVKARYRDIVAMLGPREFRLSLIQAPDRASIRKAEQALQQGQEFAQVARAHSRVPSAARGGELDWVSFRLPAREGHTSGVPLPIARALPTLKPGQVSAPISLGDSWALVRLDAERATLVPTFDAVERDLRRELAATAVESATREFVVSLLKGAQIKVFD